MRSIEYLHEPIDVIRMRCFGQKPSIQEWVTEKCISKVARIFEVNATEKGLPTTFERYLVRASA